MYARLGGKALVGARLQVGEEPAGIAGTPALPSAVAAGTGDGGDLGVGVVISAPVARIETE
ncbi:MAG: hypothetical protein P8R42_29790 [Candidatus Binatia bacterium]|nr:hypothetical protein [Candidatus Binatia bacterium]